VLSSQRVWVRVRVPCMVHMTWISSNGSVARDDFEDADAPWWSGVGLSDGSQGFSLNFSLISS
jgi:hypothetical protein